MPTDETTDQQTCSNMVWRACWPQQVASFEDKDVSAFSPSTEMTGNPCLDGKPCLIFSRDRMLAQAFLETRQGGRLLELCLDNLYPNEWQIWPKTQDIHVSVEAVFREAKLVDT
jgi:hypothetical protein